MKNRKTYLISSLIIFIICFILLASGSSLLTYSLNSKDTIPLGTFITWFGIISLPLIIYFSVSKLREPIIKFHKLLAIILKLIFGLAFLWIVVSYLLSGNFSFSFTEKNTFQGGQLAMKIFWKFTYSLVIVPMLILLAYCTSILFIKLKK